MTFSVRHIVVLLQNRTVSRGNQPCASEMVRNEVSGLVSAACLIRSASRCCDTFQCNIGITAIIFERTYVIISHARRIDCLDFSSVGEICVGCFHGGALFYRYRQVKEIMCNLQIRTGNIPALTLVCYIMGSIVPIFISFNTMYTTRNPTILNI